MRDPRAGLVWTQGRVLRRATYDTYMGSKEWWLTREWWHAEYVRIIGHEPGCIACGAGWTLRHRDLHHRTYERLGREQFGDLISLCRPCHIELHQRLESSVAMRKLGRATATDMITSRMVLERTVKEGMTHAR